jgi:hypothetical protein
MWIIAAGIAIAMAVVLGADGLHGIPGQWVGVGVGSLLCVTAFGLGYVE